LRRIGLGFEFEVPDTWLESREGSRFVYEGGSQELLTISGAVIEGIGDASELEVIRRQLFDGAVRAVSAAAANPELRTVKPLSKESTTDGVDCWTIHSETEGREIMLSQAICTAPRGVLVITFEAANEADALAAYRRFLGSVKIAAHA